MKYCKIVIFSLFLLFFTQILDAQKNYLQSGNLPEKKNAKLSYKPGHIFSSYGYKDSTFNIATDMTEMIDVVVEFKEQPLFIQMKENSLSKPNLSSYKARQAQLASAVMQMHTVAQKVYNTKLNSPVVTREFYKLFNGCKMKVPRAILADIAELDYVKNIYPARKYTVDIKESVEIIGANQIWSQYLNKGDSVVVGIIDTGIDYLHPALGGGFGKGFKVIGGYDYINNDKDPMDDHRHGTHVAGIVAGNNNVIQGVAPNALLMAFKVIGEDGYGEDKEVIAGIEGAVDPNDDNNFDDKVDIANMSLGDASGNGNDPVSIAVNNAVKLGVTFCVSAGNNYNYNTIGSPAGASEAITVAASNKSDHLANFSSKGPSNETYSLKPDITAPGVFIYSSTPGNTYSTFDGTSMASPMVAGVCALIKKQHREWTPAMIKSAIMTSAKDIGADVLSQGNGRVQANNAIKVSTFSYPSSLSFGLDNPEYEIWEKKDTIQIYNNYSTTQNYYISISGEVQGVSIKADNQAFSLQPGQMKSIVFALGVNNKVIKDSFEPHNSFMGKVKITGTKDTLIIPWSFSKLAIVTLNFNKPVLSFLLMNQDNNYLVFDSASSGSFTKTRMVVPPGNYRVWAEFAKLNDLQREEGEVIFVFRNNVQIEGYKEINISTDEAVNIINFNGVDENGRLLKDGENSMNTIVFQLDDANYYKGWALNLCFWSMNVLPGKMSVRTSNADDTLFFAAGQFQNSINKEKRIRIVQHPLIKSIRSGVNLSNKTTDFLCANLNVSLPAERNECTALFTNSYVGPSFGINMFLMDDKITERNWNGKLLLTKEVDKENVFSTSFNNYHLSDSATYLFYENPIFRTSGDSIGFSSNFLLSGQNKFYPNNFTFTFGNGIIYPQEIYQGFKDGTILDFYFNGIFNEIRNSDAYFSTLEIFNKDQALVLSRKLYENGYYNLPVGNYKYVIKNNNYFLNGIHGLATLKADVQLVQTDLYSYCPVPGPLKVCNSKGFPVTKFYKGDEGYLSIGYKSSQINTSASKIYLRKNNSPDWIEVKPESINSVEQIMKVNLNNFTNVDSGKVDLKIALVNTQNLVSEYILEPAFTIGNFVTSVNADSIKTMPAPKQFALHANYPNPFNPSTIIKYEIPKQSHVELKVFDILGREIVTLIDQVQTAGVYNAVFNAEKLSSGIYFYSIKADGYNAVRKMLLIK